MRPRQQRAGHRYAPTFGFSTWWERSSRPSSSAVRGGIALPICQGESATNCSPGRFHHSRGAERGVCSSAQVKSSRQPMLRRKQPLSSIRERAVARSNTPASRILGEREDWLLAGPKIVGIKAWMGKVVGAAALRQDGVRQDQAALVFVAFQPKCRLALRTSAVALFEDRLPHRLKRPETGRTTCAGMGHHPTSRQRLGP